MLLFDVLLLSKPPNELFAHTGGVCCIDEFDGLKEADKTSILEVMEQQTLSVAKAGLVTSLNTHTSVFGAMNPRGDGRDSVAEQTQLSGPLLSRFDILLPVYDSKDAEMDDSVSEHILTNHQLHNNPEVQVGFNPVHVSLLRHALFEVLLRKASYNQMCLYIACLQKDESTL